MSMSLDGGRELDFYFATITGKLQRKYLRQGVRTAGSEIIKRGRANLRANGSHRRKRGDLTKTGTVGLSRSLTQRPSSKWPSGPSLARKGIIGAAVGAKWPDGAHAHLVELGHMMVTHDGRAVGFVAPKPFLRPAADAVQPRYRQLQAAAVRKGMDKEAAKLKRG